jgi:hypothetical protein
VNGASVYPVGHGQALLLTVRTPLIRLAELQGRYAVKQVGVRFGELNCLVPVPGFDHSLALLEPKIHGVAGGGKIFGQFRVAGVAA